MVRRGFENDESSAIASARELARSARMALPERAALQAAFALDRELERDTAFLLRGLSAIGLGEVFMTTFGRRLASAPRGERPAGAVMRALEETIAAAERGAR